MTTESGQPNATTRALEGDRPLREVPVRPLHGALSQPLARFAAEALRRSQAADCFHFVPCETLALYTLLDALPRGRYCEWGSGAGIGVGLAESLGFEACGIELHPALAEISRAVLRDFGFRGEIATGSLFEVRREADLYFCYAWPGQVAAIERHFAALASDASLLILGHGAADLRCKRVEATRA